MTLATFQDFDLAPALLKALAKKGYTRPTAIQQETIPATMEQRDVLGSAPTGTGKTAAFYCQPFSTYLITHVANRAPHVF